jgi:hypothetical protein
LEQRFSSKAGVGRTLEACFTESSELAKRLSQ